MLTSPHDGTGTGGAGNPDPKPPANPDTPR